MKADSGNGQVFAPSGFDDSGTWSRQYEAELLDRCLKVARGRRRIQDRDEADICRLIGQLLTTRFPKEAGELDTAALTYFKLAGQVPRPYLQVIKDGLVRDLPRLRNMMEMACDGNKVW